MDDDTSQFDIVLIWFVDICLITKAGFTKIKKPLIAALSL